MIPHTSQRHPRHRLHEKKDKIKAWVKMDTRHLNENLQEQPISVSHPEDPRAIESAQAADSTAEFAVNYRSPLCNDIVAPQPHPEYHQHNKKKRKPWFCC